jgi:hypothetical protein
MCIIYLDFLDLLLCRAFRFLRYYSAVLLDFSRYYTVLLQSPKLVEHLNWMPSLFPGDR